MDEHFIVVFSLHIYTCTLITNKMISSSWNMNYTERQHKTPRYHTPNEMFILVFSLGLHTDLNLFNYHMKRHIFFSIEYFPKAKLIRYVPLETAAIFGGKNNVWDLLFLFDSFMWRVCENVSRTHIY